MAGTILVAGCRGGGNWTAKGEAETKRRGDLIISAIEKYHAETGAYPPTLTSLVPEYMTEIPAPVVGKGVWHYLVRPERQFYEISVEDEARTGPNLFYNTDNKTWYKDTR
jgi:hypothetical protein